MGNQDRLCIGGRSRSRYVKRHRRSAARQTSGIGDGELEAVCTTVTCVGRIGQVRRSAAEGSTTRIGCYVVGERQRRTVRIGSGQRDGSRRVMSHRNCLRVGGRHTDYIESDRGNVAVVMPVIRLELEAVRTDIA